MAGVLDSDIGILDKDHSESKRLHEVEDNHRTEIDSLLEQNESKNDQSVVSYDTEKHTSVKNRVQIINAQLQTTAEPTTSNNLPLSANQIDSNNRPSKEKVRTSMSKKWKFINPRLKCFIRILIISIVVAGLVGATAFITQAFVKKTNVCNGNNYTDPQNDRIFNNYTGIQNDPFCRTAFPKKESVVNLICFLPFKGKYTLKTVFENGSKGSNVSKICSEANKTHQYKLYCNKDDVMECEIQRCSEECSKFNISLSEMHVIEIQFDTSCLSLNGIIAIWNSTIKQDF